MCYVLSVCAMSWTLMDNQWLVLNVFLVVSFRSLLWWTLIVNVWSPQPQVFCTLELVFCSIYPFITSNQPPAEIHPHNMLLHQLCLRDGISQVMSSATKAWLIDCYWVGCLSLKVLPSQQRTSEAQLEWSLIGLLVTSLTEILLFFKIIFFDILAFIG